MKLRRLKKGFTLVELLVVIAILAVLAGVSVIAYFGFTSQARQSADEQAVTQMNVALQAQEAIEKPADVEEAKDVLEDAGFAVEDYVPLEKQNIFYYDQQSNRVLIFDQEESKVTYPQEMADKYSDTSEKVGYWFLLNDKTYEWVGFAPSDTSDISKASEELATALESLGDTELLRLNGDITINEDFSSVLTTTQDKKENPKYTYYHYYFPSNDSNNVHIDLNGHTLTFNYELNFGGYDTVTKAGAEKESFTFSNGKIVGTSYTSNETSTEKPADGTTAQSKTQLIVGENSNVTFSDCEIVLEANGTYNQFSVNDYGNLTLSNCKLTADQGNTTNVLLAGNGSETNIFDSTLTCTTFSITSNASIGMSFNLKAKVDNSYIKSVNGAAILLNVPGEYNFSNCTIYGGGQGVFVRGGNATIENSKIYIEGDSSGLAYKGDTSFWEFSDPEHSPFPSGSGIAAGHWGSGNYAQFAGIVVGDCAGAYAYNASCKIVDTDVHMDDEWNELPIVYLSQDNGWVTEFIYDEATCKFYNHSEEVAADKAIVSNNFNGKIDGLDAGIIKINGETVPLPQD